MRTVTIVLAIVALALAALASSTRARESGTADLEQLRRNQAVLMAAVNRLLAETAPVELADPAGHTSGYVVHGLALSADGAIVPARIPVAGPQQTLRGVRPGDPLWVERPGSP
jgi:hypothetical protein